MGLKVELKPGECAIMGNALIRNGDTRARLIVEGDAPILRGKDILTAATADTPAKRIYLAAQLMYLTGDLSSHNDTYFPLVRDFLEAAPSAVSMIAEMNGLIVTGDLYKALKVARSLVAYEHKLLAAAKGEAETLVTCVNGMGAAEARKVQVERRHTRRNATSRAAARAE